MIVGIHGSNNNLLVKFDDDGKTEQAGSSGHNFIDPAKAGELKSLGDTLNAAQNAFDNFLKKHKLDARAKVREALGEAANEEDDD